MKPLETKRLQLRNFISSDWEALQEMILQYEASEVAKYDQQWPTSAEEIKGVTEWFAGGDNFMAVCLKDNSHFIGFVSLNPEESQDGHVFNIGYVFNSEYHGKRYATEACWAVLERAFGELQADRVITGTAAANHPSTRLLEKLGFEKTGESTGSFWTTPDGNPVEFLGYTYTLSKDRWKAYPLNEPI